MSSIRNNASRYVQLFSEAIDGLMPQPTEDIRMDEEPLDVILHQRREKQDRNAEADPETTPFPAQLMRR